MDTEIETSSSVLTSLTSSALQSPQSTSQQVQQQQQAAADPNKNSFQKKKKNRQEKKSLITRPQMNPNYPAGQLVWAKSGRQPYWPGQVCDPNAKECTKHLPQLRPDLVLVHFFGSYEYHYVNPVCLSPWEPNQTERIKKSRSIKFVKGCGEISVVHGGGEFPQGWDQDDMSVIQASLDRLKQTRPDVAELAAEESRRISLGLITHHVDGFRPLKKPGNDSRAKKRRDLRQAIMRRLCLIEPASLDTSS